MSMRGQELPKEVPFSFGGLWNSQGHIKIAGLIVISEQCQQVRILKERLRIACWPHESPAHARGAYHARILITELVSIFLWNKKRWNVENKPLKRQGKKKVTFVDDVSPHERVNDAFGRRTDILCRTALTPEIGANQEDRNEETCVK